MQGQLFATLRDLDDFGPAAALAAIPARRRLANLRFASGHFATFLRRRYALPLVPWVELVDKTGLAATATVTFAGSPAGVQDVVVRFPDAGTVGVVGLTYELSVDAGATFAAAATLPLSGLITVDGVVITFGGILAADNQVSYSTGVDEALRGHVCAFASWKLLHNRGLDPGVEQELKDQLDAALAWGEHVRTGEALLNPAHDSTPDLSEEGPQGSGQTSPYEFLDEP